VHSPHFMVATNSNEKQARRIADQFERMRSLFHVLFPKLQLDAGIPILILAVSGEKEFRSLEPESALAKGQLKIGGLFLRAPDKNYILMRLDVEYEHPYAVIYHEYTHLVIGESSEAFPLWLNEGLAEFYQNTDIYDKDVSLGQPSYDDLQWLKTHPLLPLPTLFTVDAKSPYYNEENKGSIFYAESWALVHFIHIRDFQEKGHRLTNYANLIAKHVDPISAATMAFGDLKQLQKALDHYVQQQEFLLIKVKTSTKVDESQFKSRFLTLAQADALRADFLAYNQRGKNARALLNDVLREDPNNVSADETMGYLEFRDGHIDEAKKWYAKAVQLDSQSYLAHYYYAAMFMEGQLTREQERQVENSLRRAIQLNPSFAPSFDRLAVFLGSRHRDLEEAHTMGLTAVSLDPSNVAYRINVANILMQMERGHSAVEVLQTAAKLAKTPEQIGWVDKSLRRAQDFEAQQDRLAAEQRRMDLEPTASGESVNSPPANVDKPLPRLKRRDPASNSPHLFVAGILKDVHCDLRTIDLAIQTGAKTLSLHSENYYEIQFATLGFQTDGKPKPCTDLEGRSAKLEYQESTNNSGTATLISIELGR